MEQTFGYPISSVEALFRSHHADIRRFAGSLVPCADVDDLVSDTFYAAMHKIERVPQASRRAWLFGTVRNIARNRRAKNRRERAAMARIAETHRALPMQVGADHVSPTEHVAALANTLGLGGKDRALLVMVGVFEMTPTEIANHTGRSSGSVRLHLHRLRNRCRGHSRTGRYTWPPQRLPPLQIQPITSNKRK